MHNYPVSRVSLRALKWQRGNLNIAILIRTYLQVKSIGQLHSQSSQYSETIQHYLDEILLLENAHHKEITHRIESLREIISGSPQIERKPVQGDVQQPAGHFRSNDTYTLLQSDAAETLIHSELLLQLGKDSIKRLASHLKRRIMEDLQGRLGGRLPLLNTLSTLT